MARRLQSCKSAIQTKENRNASANPKNSLTFNPFLGIISHVNFFEPTETYDEKFGR